MLRGHATKPLRQPSKFAVILSFMLIFTIVFGAIAYVVHSSNSKRGSKTNFGLPGGAAAVEWTATSIVDDRAVTTDKAARLVRLEVTLPNVQGVTNIAIKLRPEFSPEGAEYIRKICLDAGKGAFYRAEVGFLLQGELRGATTDVIDKKGPCPKGVDPDIYRNSGRECFSHDPNCGCHGPMMTKGMVGWAGGAGGGPHFFIYMGSNPARDWLHDHTVWGELADEASKDAVERILELPSAAGEGMTMLRTRVPFQVAAA